MSQEVKEYMAIIGRRGGMRSRRKLDPQTARDMVRVREARRAFREFYAECFWSFDPAYRVTLDDVAWVADQLMRHGGRNAWATGARLCR